MTEQTPNKERETLAAFAGLVILFAALSILFGVTSPTLKDTGESSESTNDSDAVVEETEIAEVVLEPTSTSIPEPTEDTTTSTSAVDISFDPEAAARGEILFVTCSACHGADGRGITGLGKDLVESEFVHSLTDDELVAFITIGRPIWDAANTTMIDMPPKGGNPAFTEDDLHDIVAYIRSLQP